jgi:hypothetical protein
MGKDLRIIGNHSIRFKGRKMQNTDKIIANLNALHLEKSEFLKDMCKIWNSSFAYLNDENAKREKEELEEALKTLSWSIREIDNMEFNSQSTEYFLQGTFQLNVKIEKHFFEIFIWIGRYWHWFRNDVDHNNWQTNWRLIIYKILKVFGGNYVIYFPDNASDICSYLPMDYDFPEEMEEYLEKKISNLDDLVEIISQDYEEPISLSDAIEQFEGRCNDPFVIDYFEDLKTE